MAIIRKDLIEFSRDKLWMILTPLALLMFTVVFWLMPASMDEIVSVGVSPPALAFAFAQLGDTTDAAAQGLRLVAYDSEEAMAAAIANPSTVEAERRVSLGLAFPEGFLLNMAMGRSTTVRVYADAAVPPELRSAMTSAMREMAFTISGSPLPVTMPADEAIILGTDRLGAQIPLRERMRPMLAFLVLMVEALALASLIASEVGSRTVTALLVTPAKTADVVAAKGILGAILAFAQAFILLLVTRSLGVNAPVLLAAVVLGAFLVSGIAMFTGAAGKDFMSTLFYGVAFLIPLMIPAFALLFPGTTSPWVQLLPSYGIIQAMVGATAYQQGFGELAGYFLSGAAWVVALFALGWLALQRRVASL